jgi:type III secretion protein Q
MKPTLVATPAPLTGRLPQVSPAEARLSRTVFDRRFTRWIDRLLASGGPKDAPRSRLQSTQGAAGLVAQLTSRHGEIELTSPAFAWPALELAAGLPDAALARDVAETLLAEPLALLASWLPGLALKTLRARPLDPAPAELCWGEWRVGLKSLDEGVARQIGSQMRRTVAADLAPLHGLRLPTRLRLARREFALADLRTLAAGDVLACTTREADKRLRCQLLIGLGTFMQATAETDLDSTQATLSQTPALDREAHPDAPMEAASIGALNVPVSFEIDSARVGLDELAAFDAGSVITLDAPVKDALVRLVCFGQVVGVGRLVAVGDCLGVRIERIGLPDAIAAKKD